MKAMCPFCYEGTLKFEKESGLVSCNRCHKNVEIEGLDNGNISRFKGTMSSMV
jgi:hypothetical protein